MREAGLQGVSRRKRVHTTRQDPQAQPSKDLVQRHFMVDGPNLLWVSDLERHEALLYHAVMKGHRLQPVAAG